MAKALSVGCGGGLVFILLIAAGLYPIGPRLADRLEELSAEQRQRRGRWSAMAESWGAPADGAGPNVLFPAQAARYRLMTHDRAAAVSEVDLPGPGHHGVYGSGETAYDVFVYRATELEKDALFRRLSAAVDKRYDTKQGALRYKSGPARAMDGRQLIYTIGSPKERGVLWWQGPEG